VSRTTEGALSRIMAGRSKRTAKAVINVPVANLPTGDSVAIPVHVIRGREEGPCLVVCAAIHGDEINGVQIIRRLLGSRYLRGLRGTLIAVPIVNVFGFLGHSRYLPDRRDLNRSFPGLPRGSLAARLAHVFLTEIMSYATHVVDLHTASVHRANLPQVRCDLGQPDVEDLATAFDVPVVVHSTVRDGSLRSALQDQGKPVVVYEAGEALRFDPLAIRVGVRGVLRAMHTLGMTKQAPTHSRAVVEPYISEKSSWVRAPVSGVMTLKTRLGAYVREGQIVATIGDPFGTEEIPVRSPGEGVVIGEVRLPVIHEGDALLHFARITEGDEDETRSAMQAFQSEFATPTSAGEPAQVD